MPPHHSSLRARVCYGAILSGIGTALILSCTRSSPSGPDEPAEAAITIWVDTLAVQPGRIVTVNVRLRYGDVTDTVADIGAFDLLIYYDSTALQFINVDRGPGLDGWEYWTWRSLPAISHASSTARGVRFVALRDINNGQDPIGASRHPGGTIARLRFFASQLPEWDGQCTRLWFHADTFEDNVLADAAGDILYTPESHTGVEFGPEYDTTDCASRVFECRPVIAFLAGGVCISDTLIGVLGDIDLDGNPFEIGDAALLELFFLHGHEVWHPDPAWAAKQIAASDVNHDGQPLTLADLEFLKRLHNGTNPRPGHDPPDRRDTVNVWFGDPFGPYEVRIRCRGPLSALWLLVSHPSQDTIHPQWIPDNLESPPVQLTVSTKDRWSRILITNWQVQEIMQAGYRVKVTIPHIGNGEMRLYAAQVSAYPGTSLRTESGILIGGPGP